MYRRRHVPKVLYVGYIVYLLSVLPVQNLRFLDWRVHFGAAKVSMFGTPKLKARIDSKVSACFGPLSCTGLRPLAEDCAGLRVAPGHTQ